MLRSVLWGITNNLRRATRWASFVGQLIAWIMIVAGIAMAFGVQIPFFGTGLISGLWLAFIGWFLNSAAVQSNQQVEIQDILEGITVANLMRRNPPTVPPDTTVANLVHDHVMGSDDQAFPVLRPDGRLAGIVTLDDVRRVPRGEWDTRLVQDIMTPAQQLVTATPNEDAAQALEKLIQRDVRQLPVVLSPVGVASPAAGRLPAPGFPPGSPMPIPATGEQVENETPMNYSPGGAPQVLGLLRRQDLMRWLQLHSRGSGSGGEPI